MLLAADVGGTKSRLALFEVQKKLVCTYEKKLFNRDYPDLYHLIKDFLKARSDVKITSACIGVAGPVEDGRCHETNIPWIIDARELSEELKLPHVWVINDLEANAWGLSTLGKEEFLIVNAGEKREGNQALLSAGTGLGEAGIHWDGEQHIPFACEGGHADFAATNEEEIDLFRYMKLHYSHVSYERVLCGMGLYHLYRFVVDTKREQEDPEVALIAAVDEPQKLITKKALEGSSKACVRAVQLFVSIYGAEAGNFALKMMATGGVFIGGGIAPLLLPFFKEKRFVNAFISKGRFAELLKRMPVSIVLNDRTALLGAARYAKERE